jgi:hypothetical protein
MHVDVAEEPTPRGTVELTVGQQTGTHGGRAAEGIVREVDGNRGSWHGRTVPDVAVVPWAISTSDAVVQLSTSRERIEVDNCTTVRTQGVLAARTAS